jgi:hypothetical protein
MRELGCSRATAFRKLARKRERQRTLRERLLASKTQFSPLIKPTDSWNFNEVLYPRIDDQPETYGYIPGDLYANALFYFARPGDLVIAPMAGSGQIRHVYEDRDLWTKGLAGWDIDLRMFDLTPRGPYASLIRPWNMLEGFPPVERSPDYVIMDVPYFGMCREQYSTRRDDIANMDLAGWSAAMTQIAEVCADAGAKRCTIVVATFVDSDRREVVLGPEIVREAWRAVGYRLERVCYASKRIQASRRDRMAILNNRAKRDRLPQGDVCEVLTFVPFRGCMVA